MGLNPLDILVCAPEYPPWGSGIAKAVNSLTHEMNRIDVKAEVYTPSRRRKRWLTTANLPGATGLIPFWQEALLYAKKNFHRFDAIWLHSPLILDFGSFQETKISTVLTFHTTYLGYLEAYTACGPFHLLPYYHLVSCVERRFLRRLSTEHDQNLKVTAVSPSVADELIRNGRLKQVSIIPNGLNHVEKNTFSRKEARQKMSSLLQTEVEEDDSIVLSVGRIDYQKRSLLLARIFKRLAQLNPRVKLVILGTGPLYQRLKKEVEGCKAILAPGFVSQFCLTTLLRGANTFASLSCYEGLPLAVLEAAANQLPLILSDIAPHRWILDTKIGRGILVHRLDPFLDLETIMHFIEQVSTSNSFLDTVTNPPKSEFLWSDICRRYERLLAQK